MNNTVTILAAFNMASHVSALLTLQLLSPVFDDICEFGDRSMSCIAAPSSLVAPHHPSRSIPGC